MNNDLLEKARMNCVARAESLMQAELAQVQAKYQARLNPSETLVLLEAIKLQLQESKLAFADSDTEKGLELFSLAHSKINGLDSKLITSPSGY
jgi:hypothetical protein